MRAQEHRLAAVTANLANVSTHGFKRQESVTHGFHVGSEGSHPVTATRTDFSQGELERTGNPLDLALRGQGFFAVEAPDGEVYTRAGSFQVGRDGVLQTTEGYPVAWDGSRGRLDPASEAVSVDFAGTVFQGPDRVGRIKLVDFAAKDELKVGADSYFRASPALRVDDADAEVHQGALERSNSSSVSELVSLITVQRSFDAASSVLKMIDQSYQRLNQSR